MSLINQMLQDLEQRRASSSERRALPNQVRVLPPAQGHSTYWWLLGGAAAVLIAALAWQLNRPVAPVPVQAESMSAPAPELSLIPPPVSPQPAPAPAPEQVPTAAVLPAEAQPSINPASKLALDLGKAPAAESEPVRPIARDVAPQPAKDPGTTPRASAGVRDASINAQTPLAVPSAVTVEAKAEPGKTVNAATDTVTVMKAIPVASTAPPPPVPAASASPAPPAVPPPALQAAASAKPGASPPSPATARPVDDSKTRAALPNPQIDKRSQQLTAQQLAESEYRDGANFLNQGKLVEAQEGFRLALQHYPAHVGARQGLFGVLLEAKKTGEAEQVLQEGLKLNPNQPGFAMALARLQVDRGDTVGAVETLQRAAPSALNSPDYLAFHAALLQRQSRHQEAIDHYQAALRLAPQSGVWLMGLGISLQAINRNGEAQDTFRRAKASNTLNPELQAFVDQRIRQLQ